MREVSPGDLILSFVDTRIAAIGIADSYCYESPKPLEFGQTGAYWNNVGWRVRVNFQPLQNQVRPKAHIEFLRPLFPDRYSPLQPNGNGIQSVYLTELSPELFGALVLLIGTEASHLREVASSLPLQDRQLLPPHIQLSPHPLHHATNTHPSIT